MRERVCWLAALAVAAAQRSLLVHPDTDPHANEDPFLALTASELRRTWSHSSSEEEEHPAGAGGAGAGGASAGAGAAAAPSSLAGRMAAIRELVDATYVDVRLVGFGGEGNLGVEIGEAELQRLLDAAPAIAAPHVVHPAPGEPHALPIRRRFVRAVTRAPAPLAASISDAISQAVHASGLAVPVAAVDALVREDYLRRSTSHVTLYVLNPVPPRRRASVSEMAQHDLMGWEQVD